MKRVGKDAYNAMWTAHSTTGIMHVQFVKNFPLICDEAHVRGEGGSKRNNFYHVCTLEFVAHFPVVIPRLQAHAWVRVKASKYVRQAKQKLTPTPEMTAIFALPCSSRAILSASSINNMPNPLCWYPDALKPWTATAAPYTCNSLTIETPPADVNSGLKVESESFLNRRSPINMSCPGSSYEMNCADSGKWVGGRVNMHNIQSFIGFSSTSSNELMQKLMQRLMQN